MSDTFWVVERFENDRSAGYWDGASSRSFQPDIARAIQFRRKQDAFWATRGWHWKDVQLTEHLMLDVEKPEYCCPECASQSGKVWPEDYK